MLHSSKAIVIGLAALSILGLVGGTQLARLNHPHKVAAFASQKREMPETDSPAEAIKWRHLAWVDENGQIPQDGMVRALRQKEALAKRSHPLVSGSQWIEQGPASLSGRSTCLVVDPNHPLTMWMGSAGGGIWKSLDGGTTWNPVADALKSLAVNALIMDPNDQKTLYAGTGEGTFNIDAVSGFGIFKSVDGGTTWTQLASTNGWQYVNRIAIQPGNSNNILVSLHGGIYRSTDGGGSWTRVYASQSAQSIAFCATNTQRVIGTIQDYNNGWFSAAVYSTDGGATWTKATGPLASLGGFGRIETAPVASNQLIVYASGSDGLVYKSTDGGASYAAVTTSGNSGAGWYGNAIWVDPTNPNRVVVGGTYVYGSTDGGMTLTLIGQGYIQTSEPHPDIHALYSAPGYDGQSNKSVYVCTDGGLYQAVDITTANASTGWLRRDQGARSTQYYSVAGDGPSGRIVGGLQDNGTQSNLVGNNQSFYIYGGDGGYVAIDPQNSQYVYGEYIYLQIFRNSDGASGYNDANIYNGIGDAGSGNTANFIAPFILDPNQPGTMLAGGRSLWRSTNVRATNPSWTAIRPAGSQNISAIAVAKGNSDVIWVGQNDGVLTVTTNGTSSNPTWTTVSSGGSKIPQRYITRILVDPDNASTVYLTLGGFSFDNVWKTTDGGNTWNSISGSGLTALPQVPVRAIARNPDQPNTLYVGTEIGLFSSTDGGATWSTSSDLGVNVSVDELAYMNNSKNLLAGTHGRGVWMLPGAVYQVQSLSVNPTSIPGGSTSTGTVTISQPAPGSGQMVSLSTSSNDVSVPATVVVPAGATTTTFNITSVGVNSSETVNIYAVIGSSQKGATLTLQAPGLNSVTASPSTVTGGNTSIGTVTLSAPAGGTGVTVNLASNSTKAGVPKSVTIPIGSSSATFTITTLTVTSSSSAAITASLAGVNLTTSITILPAQIQSITLSNSTVVGGAQISISGTATLAGPAATGGTVVTLTSSNTKVATVLASVKVPAGASSVNFVVTHLRVSATQTVTISGKTGTVSKGTTLVVNPFQLVSMSISPSSVPGTKSASGSVTLNAVPGTKSGAIIVKLSSPSKAVKLPASVSVAIGTSVGKFTVGTVAVSSDTVAVVTGTYGSSAQTANLTVTAPTLVGFKVTPTTVKGSATTKVVVTVTLSGPAPTGGMAVALSSSNSSAATLPASVVIPAGLTSASFTVGHKAVTATTSVTLTSRLGNNSLSTVLAVTP